MGAHIVYKGLNQLFLGFGPKRPPFLIRASVHRTAKAPTRDRPVRQFATCPSILKHVLTPRRQRRAHSRR
jgi:hypothetical protein